MHHSVVTFVSQYLCFKDRRDACFNNYKNRFEYNKVNGVVIRTYKKKGSDQKQYQLCLSTVC
jgi:hypothetical protein